MPAVSFDLNVRRMFMVLQFEHTAIWHSMRPWVRETRRLPDCGYGRVSNLGLDQEPLGFRGILASRAEFVLYMRREEMASFCWTTYPYH